MTLVPQPMHHRHVEIANALATWINDVAPKALDVSAVYGAHVLLCDLIERVKALEALAYLGEHHFPDLTYKARLEELVPVLRRVEAEHAALVALAKELAVAALAVDAMGEADDEPDERTERATTDRLDRAVRAITQTVEVRRA